MISSLQSYLWPFCFSRWWHQRFPCGTRVQSEHLDVPLPCSSRRMFEFFLKYESILYTLRCKFSNCRIAWCSFNDASVQYKSEYSQKQKKHLSEELLRSLCPWKPSSCAPFCCAAQYFIFLLWPVCGWLEYWRFQIQHISQNCLRDFHFFRDFLPFAVDVSDF